MDETREILIPIQCTSERVNADWHQTDHYWIFRNWYHSSYWLSAALLYLYQSNLINSISLVSITQVFGRCVARSKMEEGAWNKNIAKWNWDWRVLIQSSPLSSMQNTAPRLGTTSAKFGDVVMTANSGIFREAALSVPIGHVEPAEVALEQVAIMRQKQKHGRGFSFKEANNICYDEIGGFMRLSLQSLRPIFQSPPLRLPPMPRYRQPTATPSNIGDDCFLNTSQIGGPHLKQNTQ